MSPFRGFVDYQLRRDRLSTIFYHSFESATLENILYCVSSCQSSLFMPAFWLSASSVSFFVQRCSIATSGRKTAL